MGEPVITLETQGLPSDWQTAPFEQCVLEGGIERKASIQQGGYRPTGRFPVVDQGSSLIAGYTEDENLIHRDDLPLILFGDHTRVFKFLDFPFATGADGTKLFRANEELVEPKFLYYALLHLDIPSRGYNRHFKYLKEKTIAVPVRFHEQREIAAVLSKIQKAAEVQEKIVCTLEELKAATMAKLFREGLRGEPLKQTEIGEIPKSWEIIQLGKIAKIGNGSTPKRDKPAYWENGNIPWLTSAKIHESVIESADEFVTEIARGECHLPLVRKHSIVVAITGQGKTLGNAAIVTFDTCVSQHLAYIQFETDEVLPEFVLFFLQGRYRDLRQVSQSGGSTRGALTCGFLKNYCVPIPPIEEQRGIARMLGLLSIRVKREEGRRQIFQSLFSSMLHLLMTGRVRVNQLDSSTIESP